MAAKSKSKRPSRKRQAAKPRKSPRKTVRKAPGISAERRRIEREIAEAEAYARQLRREAASLAKREKAEKKRRSSAEKRRRARRTKAGKARERESKRKARSRTATTREIHEVSRLVRWGIYTPKKVKKRKGPKGKTRIVYTKGQAAYARRRSRKFRHEIETEHFVPVRSAAERKIWREAGRTVTAKGVYVPISEKAEEITVAKRRIKRGKLKGRPEIVVTEKRAPGVRKKRVIHVAVTPGDLASQDEDLRRRFEAAFRKQPPDARIRFYVEGRFGSARTFARDQFGSFLAVLAGYRPKGGDQLFAFRRAISIGVTQPTLPRMVHYQPRAERKRRRARVLRERRAGTRK